MKHLGSLESTQEARVAMPRATLMHLSCLQTSHVLHISMNACWCMNQLLISPSFHKFRYAVFIGLSDNNRGLLLLWIVPRSVKWWPTHFEVWYLFWSLREQVLWGKYTLFSLTGFKLGWRHELCNMIRDNGQLNHRSHKRLQSCIFNEEMMIFVINTKLLFNYSW